jgi:hypothetical protein
MVESLNLWKKAASKVKGKRLTMLRVAIGVGRIHSKTITFHPLHPKSPTSISTLLLLPENLSLKPNTKESRNNYLHYHCP